MGDSLYICHVYKDFYENAESTSKCKIIKRI